MFNIRESMVGTVTGRLVLPDRLSASSQATRVPRHAFTRGGSQGRRGQGPRAWSTLLILILLALTGGGCNGWFKPVGWSELGAQNKPQQPPFRVVARQNKDTASLTPDDVVNVMQRVGFADEQILDLGTNLHNALRFSGAAAIVYRKDTLALFQVNGGYLEIRSRSGTFDYDITRSRFIALPATER